MKEKWFQVVSPVDYAITVSSSIPLLYDSSFEEFPLCDPGKDFDLLNETISPEFSEKRSETDTVKTPERFPYLISCVERRILNAPWSISVLTGYVQCLLMLILKLVEWCTILQVV